MMCTAGSAPTSGCPTKVNVTMPSGTLRNLGWFEAARMRGAIKDGKVQRYQVTLKVGFTLE